MYANTVCTFKHVADPSTFQCDVWCLYPFSNIRWECCVVSLLLYPQLATDTFVKPYPWPVSNLQYGEVELEYSVYEFVKLLMEHWASLDLKSTGSILNVDLCNQAKK